MKSVKKDLQSDNRPTQNAALKELRRRFVGLDKEEQMQVLVHHLRREKSFREWAYSRLLDLWDESFEPIVIGVVKGEMPGRALRMILEWLDDHRPELMEKWELAQNGSPLKKIEPLK